MPFSFNAVELCVVTINEKSWTRPREVYKVLEYGKVTKAADVVKHICSRENYAHKRQLTELVSEMNFMNWPKDSRKDDYNINEEGTYELLFSSQHSEAKDFRRHWCNVMLPRIRQQLVNKMKEDHQRAIEKIQGKHQQTIDKIDAAIALLNDDLKNREHDNVVLQAQRDVYKDQLQKCRNIITHLKTRHVPHAKYPGKDNIVMIIEKNSAPKEDEFYVYPYYIARIQRQFITTKNDVLRHRTPNIVL